jgi:Flp pilus assembly secretin CpaC
MRHRIGSRFLLLIAFIACLSGKLVAQENVPIDHRVIKSQYSRLVFDEPIQRIAIGDTEIASAEVITNQEILVLGKDTGRTTLIVWFRNGAVQDHIVSVQQDLSVLRDALRRIHPSIDAEMAPDRDAIILTGRVPDVTYSQAAESVAQNYLEASANRGPAAGRTLIQSAPGAASPNPPAAPAGQVTPPAAAQPAAPPETVRVPAQVPPSGRVINLIQLEALPPLPEERIRAAIVGMGGNNVTIRRVLRGPIRDDARDVLILGGFVSNQIALVRILSVASQILTGRTASAEDIRVVADEGGALSGTNVQNLGQFGGGGGGTGILGGTGTTGLQLNNQVRRNVARATAVEVSGGRILSFIEVMDLPQVRVDVKLYELNRTKLRTYNSDLAMLIGDFTQAPLLPGSISTLLQGSGARPVGGDGRVSVQNALAFLAGMLTNQLQFTSGNFAISSALSLLERVGVARTLASPALTVLSGESALFQVGGEIPIPESFTPAFGTIVVGNAPAAASSQGVFNSVVFRPFGIQLSIRPLVGEDGTITLDVQPEVVTPDPALTGVIRQTTGTNPATVAFQTRSLRTSTRLSDGDALLMAGLLSRNASDNEASTPAIRDIPFFGWLFKDISRQDQELELIVMVNPVIVRERSPDVNLWAFPDIWCLPMTIPQCGDFD